MFNWFDKLLVKIAKKILNNEKIKTYGSVDKNIEKHNK